MVSLTLPPPAPWQAAHTVATFALPASMSAACASGAIIRTTDNPSSFVMALLPLRRDMLPEEPRHGRAADGRPARRRDDRREFVHPPLQRRRQDPHRPRQPLVRAVVARRPGTRRLHRERVARQGAEALRRRGTHRLQQRRDHPELVGPDEALHPDHAAGRDEPAARGLQHVPAGAQRAAFGQRRSRRREAFPAGALRQARIELLPRLVGELDEAEKLRGYCRNCFTLSMPTLTHSSCTPGEPDRPMPPIVSLPTLIGTPPLIAITPGNVVCSRRTGRVFISYRKASVVILNVRAV